MYDVLGNGGIIHMVRKFGTRVSWVDFSEEGSNGVNAVEQGKQIGGEHCMAEREGIPSAWPTKAGS